MRHRYVCLRRRGAPLLSSICVAHPISMRHGYGGLTPQALVLAGAHLCVAHPFFGAPRIRRYLSSIYLGAPRLLIYGAPKHSVPQIMGPWIRVFLVVFLRGRGRLSALQFIFIAAHIVRLSGACTWGIRASLTDALNFGDVKTVCSALDPPLGREAMFTSNKSSKPWGSKK
jgi:hypothetical protein